MLYKKDYIRPLLIYWLTFNILYEAMVSFASLVAWKLQQTLMIFRSSFNLSIKLLLNVSIISSYYVAWHDTQINIGVLFSGVAQFLPRICYYYSSFDSFTNIRMSINRPCSTNRVCIFFFRYRD